MTLQAEFQAVVLAAGKGSRMPEITAGKPKCLLPVGSKPLGWYPLNQLQKAGFGDVILIVLEHEKNEIQCVLEKCNLSIKIDYFPIPSTEDMIGTADSLRLISDKLISDVLVLSCDLITDGNFKGVLNMFRKHNASLASLLFHPQSVDTIVLPGPKSKHKPERDIIGIDSQTNRLVFLASASDFESQLTLPRALLKKHTHIKMFSSLIDSHVYVLKNWVIRYLKNVENISTIKGELLPHIIKKQLLKPSRPIGGNPSIVNPSVSDDIFFYAKEEKYDSLIRETSSYNDHSGDFKPAYGGDVIRCFAFVEEPDTFGIRVNTFHNYISVNNKIIEKWDQITGGEELVLQHPKAEIKSNQVDSKCFVWEEAKLNEKTSFKNSIIGSNVEVHSFSRIFNSIVMNNVTVKEKVALENCIVCNGAVIESGSNLKSCLVGSQHIIPKESIHSNEFLTDSDMEFDVSESEEHEKIVPSK